MGRSPRVVAIRYSSVSNTFGLRLIISPQMELCGIFMCLFHIVFSLCGAVFRYVGGINATGSALSRSYATKEGCRLEDEPFV